MNRMLYLCFALVLLSTSLAAQNANTPFGKNKVQYKRFTWEYIQTSHFDIYFSQDGYELASFTAQAAEDAYDSIRKLFRYEINNRVPIVVYNSHNEFQQTNVVGEYLEEGVGGVTELFKNRVVIPFEGNYRLFRHVIHHELVHAVLNDMFYGGSIQSLIASRTPLILPLWFNEGLSEYAALKWDTNSDMFLRDATIHNYLPPIDFLGGYFAYRGGQSVWYYIANKYGEQKIAEILNRIRGTRSIDQGFKSTIGLTVQELSERWQKEQKTMYWPDIAKREEPDDFASRRLTKHTNEGNFYNTSPAISPQGDRVAFISDRHDYFDVFVMSAVDGEILDKVVSGQRTKDFEELHLLTPGLTWSPNGKAIALAVKAGERDAIMIVDVENGSTQRISLELDGVFSVDWSSDGKKFAFVGLKAPQSDIYVYDIETKQLTNLTNDIFSDFDPAFSPDGRTIYFSSDRRDFVHSSMVPPQFKMWDFNFEQRDLYSVSVETGTITRLTDYPNSDESSPVVSPDGKKLLYVSDRNGINNIYELDIEKGTDRPLTNSLSGVYQLSLSRDGTKLVFSSLHEAGFDVYLMLSPFDKRLTVDNLEPTEYFKRKFALPRQEKPRQVTLSVPSTDTLVVRENLVIVPDTASDASRYQAQGRVDLRGYIFSEETMRAKDTSTAIPLSRFEVAENQDSEGNYIPRKYKLNFTPDLVYGTAAYSTFYGVEGSTLMAFSDMMGDHQIIFITNLLLDLKNSDYGIQYNYLPARIDYGFQAFHSARFLFLYEPNYAANLLYRFRTWAVGLSASYPIDRFNRIDLSALWLNLSRDNLDIPLESPQRRSFILPALSYVHDNSLWQGGWFAPSNGSRFNLTAYGSAKFNENSLDMQTFYFDYRDYNKFLREYVFAFRLSGGLSRGKDKQFFFIGGTDGWINRRFEGGSIPIVNVEDYAFLTPVLPLRGFNYNRQSGSKFAVANFEMRFPLVRYFILGALPIGFQNILGAAFVDVGSAWDDTKAWQAFSVNRFGVRRTKDLLVGTGFGARFIFFGLPFRIDVAWQFNYESFSAPFWYFSLGPEF